MAYLIPAAATDLEVLQNAAVATGNGSPLECIGHSAMALQVVIADTATVTFEATVDGTNYIAVEGLNANSGAKASTATASGIFKFDVSAYQRLRARISSWTAGAVTVKGRGLPGVSGPATADVELSASDVEIGAVEIKNDSDDTRAKVQSADPGIATVGLVVKPTQTTHDNLATNSTLQIADVDAPGGAGVVTASTPRTTLASDDPAVTALQIMDDWDETDRAKVNPIVGQAGIAAGTGVDGVTVPRVSLATDVPLPAGTNAIGKLAANSGVDIGDVDVTSEPATAADGALGLPAVTKVVSGYDGANVQVLSTNASGHVNIADGGNVLSVDDASGSLTVDSPQLPAALGAGAEAGAILVTVATDSTGVLSVDDNGGSLTVDNATLSVVGGGAQATAQRVALADESLAALETITVDFEGDASDLDSGAGTDSHAVIGLAVAADGGHAVVTGDVANGLDVDVTRSALPTGASTLAEQQTQTASLSVLDDWDETDRAKVNPVVGQAGLAAGTGLDAANALRVSLATDIALPAGTNAIGKLAANDGVDVGDVTVNNAAGAAAVNVQDGGNVLSVDDASGSLTVDSPQLPAALGAGTEAGALRVTVATDSTGVLSVDDNGASLTVDNPVLSVVGAGAEATAQRVTLATESLAALESVTANLAGDDTDLDSGAGTDNHDVVAIGLPGAGGHVVGGTATDPLRTDPTGTTTQPVSDAGGSLTVDNATLAVVGAGAEATALRTTLASESLAALELVGIKGADGAAIAANANPVPVSDAGTTLSVDDGAGSLTVDNSTLAVVGGGAQATALRVALADESLTALETITVDFEGDASDLDSGVGTDSHAVVALAVAADGGHAVLTGDVANGLDVDVTRSALPTGAATLAEQQTQTASLSVLDDWDETNRAAVNTIAGQVGVQGAAGVVTALTQRVTVATDDVVSVDDNGASLTVDNAALSVVGGGVEATALRVTVATDSTGVLSVDDNAGSLTVDNPTLSVVGAGAEATALRATLATETLAALELIGVKGADGAAIAGNANPVPVSDAGSTLSVDDGAGSLTVDNAALSVTGGGVEATALRVTLASDSTGLVSVDDNGASITVDNPILSVVGGGTEAAAQRVTIASDSTGVLSVDDNAGSITVDAPAGTPVAVAPEANASAIGATPFFDSSVTGTVEQMKGSAGNVYHLQVDNPNASKVYLQMFASLAAGVTLGTTVPTLSYVVPASGAWDHFFAIPVAFASGISYAVTTTATGNTSPGSACVLNAAYK